MIKYLLTYLIIAASVAAQPTLPNAVPMPTPEIQYLDSTGKPLVGAKLCTYAAGTSTPQATYTSSTAGTPNTNPVILDTAGRASVWVGPKIYKFVLRTGGTPTGCNDGAIVWTQDNVADTALYFVNYVQTVGTATLITYTNPLTGGVSRTVSNRLAEDNYVKDFGAVCDGSTDDHVDIQQAFNSVIADVGGRVNFPIGICSIGTTGVTLPTNSVTAPGIILHGQGRESSGLKYAGTGTALKIGSAGATAYRYVVEQMGVSITTAGANAIGVNIITCLYCNFVQAGVYSEFDRTTSRQIGLYLSGGVTSSTFGAYFKWDASEVRGSFYRGVYLDGELGWGYNSDQFIGGAIISTGSPVSGTIGLWVHQGNQNAFLNTDIENFDNGIRSDAYGNSFLASRTEGNTTGVNLTVRSMDCCAVPTSTTGGEFNYITSGSHGDGITDNSGGSAMIWETLNGSNYENHLKNNVYLDENMMIPGNKAIEWTGASGGSTGLFWLNSGMTPVDGISADADGIVHHQLNGADYLLLNPNESPVRGLEIPKGIYRNGAGFQHITIAAGSVCTTGASAGATCSWSITWNTTWVDTNYTAVCQLKGIGSGVPILNIDTTSTTTIGGKIIAGTAVAANGGVSCIGVHF